MLGPRNRAPASIGRSRPKHSTSLPASRTLTSDRSLARENGSFSQKDKNIRRNQLEVEAILNAGVRAFVVTATNLNHQQIADLVSTAIPKIARISQQKGPFVYNITSTGIVSQISRRTLRRRAAVEVISGDKADQVCGEGLQYQTHKFVRENPGVHLNVSGCHRLRHTFCSHLAMRGAPARAIQELAGHQDLTTTQRYMHLSRSIVVEPPHDLDCSNTPVGAIHRHRRRRSRYGTLGRVTSLPPCSSSDRNLRVAVGGARHATCRSRVTTNLSVFSSS
jgi:site-specific recombinase XerC